MNRGDRARMAVLETELQKVAAAEERALIRLRRQGFHFNQIGQARSFIAKAREADRVRARQVEMVDQFTHSEARSHV